MPSLSERRPGSTVRRQVHQVARDQQRFQRREKRDVLATEEPLEIRVLPPQLTGEPQARATAVAVTMRTPGADFELAAGFLYSEGILSGGGDVAAIRYCVDEELGEEQKYNVVNVFLSAAAAFDPGSLHRNFPISSSCGVCGKTSIDAVRALSSPAVQSDLMVSAGALLALPARMRARQPLFGRTGGIHAAGLFTASGELEMVREDVGRHNALDKLVGAALLSGQLPLEQRVVLASGRLSFELVQKAARAGVAVLAGVSAPSSLAAELAADTGMTLVGFLREGRFNVYTGAHRIETEPLP